MTAPPDGSLRNRRRRRPASAARAVGARAAAGREVADLEALDLEALDLEALDLEALDPEAADRDRAAARAPAAAGRDRGSAPDRRWASARAASAGGRQAAAFLAEMSQAAARAAPASGAGLSSRDQTSVSRSGCSGHGAAGRHAAAFATAWAAGAACREAPHCRSLFRHQCAEDGMVARHQSSRQANDGANLATAPAMTPAPEAEWPWRTEPRAGSPRCPKGIWPRLVSRRV
jgi:hypothetical protein